MLVRQFRLLQLQELAKRGWRELAKVNYWRLHSLYILLVSLLGGVLLYLVELSNEPSLSFIDALFMATSSVTCTGLATIDTTNLSTGGQVLVLIYILMGGMVLLSVVPVIVRAGIIWWYCHDAMDLNEMTEYQALARVIRIGIGYWLFWICTIFSLFLIFVRFVTSAHDNIDDHHVNLIWWSLFQTISSFHNAGITLYSENMIAWKRSPYVLMVTAVAILVGDMASSILMRLIVWTIYFISRKTRSLYKFLLLNPRKCYTNLFPASETRWLILTILALIGFQLIVFASLEWDQAALEGLSAFDKYINCVFSSITTFHGGFASLDYSQLEAGTIFVVTVMMYISTSPVNITLRYSDKQGISEIETEISENPLLRKKKKSRKDDRVLVFDTKKPLDRLRLRILARSRRHRLSMEAATPEKMDSPRKHHQEEVLEEAEKHEEEEAIAAVEEQALEESRIVPIPRPTVIYQARKAWTTHFLYLCLCTWIICIIEGHHIRDDPLNFNISKLLFEISSAYGNVGLSMGYPGEAYSFSGRWSTGSKLILMVVMMLGKARYLPNSIERAISIPKQALQAIAANTTVLVATTEAKDNTGLSVSESKKATYGTLAIPAIVIAAPDAAFDIESGIIEATKNDGIIKEENSSVYRQISSARKEESESD